ncbi:Uma2 family endonuclease [Paludisphaera mucosa]|uniref:Uma2 family endonuclease n=1 Tax=Paludisphaera mucosa TaxID=3030827 RepID=A0ABT6F9D0_9BACT|nr:Uma2 family endonuclease [Paludisphaera mucosa]MDG3004200.1 Uma2 family endonuclease [Paludisphaera mucosa]
MATSTIEHVRAETGRDVSTSLWIPADVHLAVDAEGFARLSAANPDLRLERAADGGLIVMTPASPDGGGRELELGAQLRNWNKATGLGKAFSPSTGFTLPDGSIRAPAASWIRRDRWEAVEARERRRFSRIIPDFAAEIRSPSDSIADLRAKMAGYLAQGVRLGWLIDPESRTVEIYRPGREPETLVSPRELSGEDVLPGFTLDLAEILYD